METRGQRRKLLGEGEGESGGTAAGRLAWQVASQVKRLPTGVRSGEEVAFMR